jgi:hypothetical protein
MPSVDSVKSQTKTLVFSPTAKMKNLEGLLFGVPASAMSNVKVQLPAMSQGVFKRRH